MAQRKDAVSQVSFHDFTATTLTAVERALLVRDKAGLPRPPIIFGIILMPHDGNLANITNVARGKAGKER
jgi:hypothetical protein